MNAYLIESFSPFVWGILLFYLLAMNIIAYALMGVDKKRAIRHAWRIPEKTLFLAAILGGSIGAILGMRHFRHKTKHWYFQYGMPLILILQIILAYLMFRFLQS